MYEIRTSCGQVFSSEKSIRDAREQYVEYHIGRGSNPLKISKVISEGRVHSEEEVEDLSEIAIEEILASEEDSGVDIDDWMYEASKEFIRTNNGR